MKEFCRLNCSVIDSFLRALNTKSAFMKTPITLLLLLLAPVTLAFASVAPDQSSLSGPQIWEQLFVPALHKKFAMEMPEARMFEEWVKLKGGRIIIDHGGTRTPDPRVHAFITRLAMAFGLKPQGQYRFPDKHLKAIDLQFEDRNGFKWFSTLVSYKGFSPKVRAAIEEDMGRTYNRLSEKGMDLLIKLEEEGQLNDREARTLVKEVVLKFLKRQGAPLKQKTLKMVANESPEAANALLLGPGFNHLAYSVNDLNVPEWYSLEVIELLTSMMEREGFTMMPGIQGESGGVLRQASTQAASMIFGVEGRERELVKIEYPGKYLEFVQRGPERDETGEIVFDQYDMIKLFRGFIDENAFNIYESTGRSRKAPTRSAATEAMPQAPEIDEPHQHIDAEAFIEDLDDVA